MFLELAKQRRSVRIFSDKAIENEKIDAIIEAGLRAPSARGTRPFHLIAVSKKETVEKLADAREHGTAFLKKAQLAIVVCGDPEKSEQWIEDCAIAAVSMQYAAHSLGLGSCWGHMRGKAYNDTTSSGDYVSQLLDIPANLEVECILGIGYPDQETKPYTKEDLKYGQVSLNSFGNVQK